MLKATQLIGFGSKVIGSAGAAATVTFTDSEYQNASNPYTSSVDIGTASSRKVVVWAGTSGGAGATGATCTVDGDAMTEVHAYVGADYNECILFQINDYTKGGTKDVVVTWASSTGVHAMAVWEVFNAAGAVDDTMDNGSDPFTGTIDVPAGGVGISGVFFSNSNVTSSWSAGLTKDYDDYTGQHESTGASDAFADEQSGMTITCTPGDPSSHRAGLAVSWGPA